MRNTYGSLTPAGNARVWEVHERTWFGDITPSFGGPFAMHSPHGASLARSITHAYVTSVTAGRLLSSLDRWRDTLERADALERSDGAGGRRSSGRIYTHATVIGSTVTVDQSSAIGGPRSGEAPIWCRHTLTTRTRDGVTYTDDVIAVDVAAMRAYLDALDDRPGVFIQATAVRNRYRGIGVRR